MKVDAACIDHNVDRLVAYITEELYDYVDNDKMTIASLGEIRGIHQLAEALKEVLRTLQSSERLKKSIGCWSASIRHIRGRIWKTLKATIAPMF